MADLPKRELGRTGMQVTMLGYGAMELRGRATPPMTGTSAGRAWLTPLGREVVQLYREIGEVAGGAASVRINRLEQLIAEGAKRASRGDARTSTVPRVANDASRSVVHASSDASKLPHRR
jgi:hypothetical protein